MTWIYTKWPAEQNKEPRNNPAQDFQKKREKNIVLDPSIQKSLLKNRKFLNKKENFDKLSYVTIKSFLGIS